MALIKVKPTSPGRRSLVKLVSPELHKGAPYAPLVERQAKRAGRNRTTIYVPADEDESQGPKAATP